MSREDSGSSVAFFILGAAMGAAAGILLAPRSGRETREQLGDWLDERRERGSELLQKVKEAMPEKKEALINAGKAMKQAFCEATGKHNHVEKETV